MKPTERFSERAGDYGRYRPGYPEAIVDYLEAEAGLSPGSHVVDIASGTGIAAALFLRRGYRVTAIEPNAAMRREAVVRLSGDERFSMVDATGEDTGLPARCADMVLCAQAFHWLDDARAAAEFRRIARPSGLIVVVWNERRKDGDRLNTEFEHLLLTSSKEYRENVVERPLRAVLALQEEFPSVRKETFVHSQILDWEGFRGRWMSASYVPLPGDPRHEGFLAALRALYDRFSQDGLVTIVYECSLYWTHV